jgi:hypothetical protein
MSLQRLLLTGLWGFAVSGALAQLDESAARRAFGGIQPALSPEWKRGRIPDGLDQVQAQLDAARAIYRRLAGAAPR